MRTAKLCLSMALAFGLYSVLPSQAAEETEARAMFTKQMDKVIDDLQDSCEADKKEFCSAVTPGEGRLLMCALAHRDKLSDDCEEAIFDALVVLDDTLNNMQFAVEACESDIKTTCGDVAPGEGRVAQCLIDNKDKISEPCQGAVADFKDNN